MTQEYKSETKPESQFKSEWKPENTRTKTAREIEAEINETRNALSGDMKALSDKVSPAHIKQEAKNALGDVKDAAVDKVLEVKDAAVEKAVEVKNAAGQLAEATVDKAVEIKDMAVDKANEAAEAISETYDEVSYEAKKAAGAVWQFAAANAVPLSLIGLGAGWLIANRRRPATTLYTDTRDDYAGLADHPAGHALHASSEPQGLPGPSALIAHDERGGRPSNGRGSHAASRTRDVATRASDGLGRASGRVTNGAQRAYRKAGEKLEHTQRALRDRASRGGVVARETYTRARDASLDFAQENPLALAAGTLVAGIGVGLLVPSTERENRLLGPGRAKMRGMLTEARDAAREVGAIAQQTARETVAAVEGQAHRSH